MHILYMVCLSPISGAPVVFSKQEMVSLIVNRKGKVLETYKDERVRKRTI